MQRLPAISEKNSKNVPIQQKTRLAIMVLLFEFFVTIQRLGCNDVWIFEIFPVPDWLEEKGLLLFINTSQ